MRRRRKTRDRITRRSKRENPIVIDYIIRRD